ncbi:organic hydroperoxide resistance protein [Actinopolyspora erythraea]|uniref:Organic hydroperoxide resistance protein n=1 Tax=Actinopolyspora erythraea TaxID=414996 RepID=A0A099D7M6_9ACTN|nr:organic hydroperoxide resistance protein [Actinopolyspora erythraea]ASU78308.1 organic hydroperoxide resistance protein [Actinopolyspora erythraea]KGI81999.1 organic hydroperoxide resistance protein [Actinopolyspora erythraea]
MTTLYTAEATASGEGRDGRTRSSDGVLDLGLSVPKELGGPGEEATNPEQLFAAGYAACFHSALRVVARRAGVSVDESTVTARVGMGPNGDGGYGLSLSLRVGLPGLDRQRALELAEAADKVCPYSNAVRGNVDIELEVA